MPLSVDPGAAYELADVDAVPVFLELFLDSSFLELLRAQRYRPFQGPSDKFVGVSHLSETINRSASYYALSFCIYFYRCAFEGRCRIGYELKMLLADVNALPMK